MRDDTFVCKNCGDVLRDPLIATYRSVISSGGSVSGAIRCARCGSIYSAKDISLKDPIQNIVDNKLDEKEGFRLSTEDSNEQANTKIITVEAPTAKDAKRILLKQKPEGTYLYSV